MQIDFFCTETIFVPSWLQVSSLDIYLNEMLVFVFLLKEEHNNIIGLMSEFTNELNQ